MTRVTARGKCTIPAALEPVEQVDVDRSLAYFTNTGARLQVPVMTLQLDLN